MTRPKKGTEIIYLDKTEYVFKIKILLLDLMKFSCDENDKDQTSKIESVACMILKALKYGNVITPTKLESLHLLGSTITRIYGLPELHNWCSNCTYIIDGQLYLPQYSSMVGGILEPIRKDIERDTLEDSFSFKNAVKTITLF